MRKNRTPTSCEGSCTRFCIATSRVWPITRKPSRSIPNPLVLTEAEAFLLSACPAPKYRNGRKAIAYATKACELTEWKDAQHVENLAAAYCETGQFEEAITWQKKAAALEPKAVAAGRAGALSKATARSRSESSEQAVPSLAGLTNLVAIKLGQKLSVVLAEKGDDLVDPKITSGRQRHAHTLLLDYKIEKKQHVLRLEHTFWRKMEGRCLGSAWPVTTTWFETDILPVPVGTINPELWSDPIEELVLFDLKLTGPSSEPTPLEEESEVASLATASDPAIR